MISFHRDRGQSREDRGHRARCPGRACFHRLAAEPGLHHTPEERLSQATTSPVSVLSSLTQLRIAGPHQKEATQVQLIFQTKTNLHRAAPPSHCLAPEQRQEHVIQLRQRHTEVTITEMIPVCDQNHRSVASQTSKLQNQESHRKPARAQDSLAVKAKRIQLHQVSLVVDQPQKAAGSLGNLPLI